MDDKVEVATFEYAGFGTKVSIRRGRDVVILRTAEEMIYVCDALEALLGEVEAA